MNIKSVKLFTLFSFLICGIFIINTSYSAAAAVPLSDKIKPEQVRKTIICAIDEFFKYKDNVISLRLKKTLQGDFQHKFNLIMKAYHENNGNFFDILFPSLKLEKLKKFINVKVRDVLDYECQIKGMLPESPLDSMSKIRGVADSFVSAMRSADDETDTKILAFGVLEEDAKRRSVGTTVAPAIPASPVTVPVADAKTMEDGVSGAMRYLSENVTSITVHRPGFFPPVAAVAVAAPASAPNPIAEAEVIISVLRTSGLSERDQRNLLELVQRLLSSIPTFEDKDTAEMFKNLYRYPGVQIKRALQKKDKGDLTKLINLIDIQYDDFETVFNYFYPSKILSKMKPALIEQFKHNFFNSYIREISDQLNDVTPSNFLSISVLPYQFQNLFKQFSDASDEESLRQYRDEIEAIVVKNIKNNFTALMGACSDSEMIDVVLNHFFDIATDQRLKYLMQNNERLVSSILKILKSLIKENQRYFSSIDRSAQVNLALFYALLHQKTKYALYFLNLGGSSLANIICNVGGGGHYQAISNRDIAFSLGSPSVISAFELYRDSELHGNRLARNIVLSDMFFDHSDLKKLGVELSPYEDGRLKDKVEVNPEVEAYEDTRSLMYDFHNGLNSLFEPLSHEDYKTFSIHRTPQSSSINSQLFIDKLKIFDSHSKIKEKLTNILTHDFIHKNIAYQKKVYSMPVDSLFNIFFSPEDVKFISTEKEVIRQLFLSFKEEILDCIRADQRLSVAKIIYAIDRSIILMVINYKEVVSSDADKLALNKLVKNVANNHDNKHVIFQLWIEKNYAELGDIIFKDISNPVLRKKLKILFEVDFERRGDLNMLDSISGTMTVAPADQPPSAPIELKSSMQVTPVSAAVDESQDSDIPLINELKRIAIEAIEAVDLATSQREKKGKNLKKGDWALIREDKAFLKKLTEDIKNNNKDNQKVLDFWGEKAFDKICSLWFSNEAFKGKEHLRQWIKVPFISSIGKFAMDQSVLTSPGFKMHMEETRAKSEQPASDIPVTTVASAVALAAGAAAIISSPAPAPLPKSDVATVATSSEVAALSLATPAEIKKDAEEVREEWVSCSLKQYHELRFFITLAYGPLENDEYSEITKKIVLTCLSKNVDKILKFWDNYPALQNVFTHFFTEADKSAINDSVVIDKLINNLSEAYQKIKTVQIIEATYTRQEKERLKRKRLDMALFNAILIGDVRRIKQWLSEGASLKTELSVSGDIYSLAQMIQKHVMDGSLNADEMSKLLERYGNTESYFKKPIDVRVLKSWDLKTDEEKVNDEKMRQEAERKDAAEVKKRENLIKREARAAQRNKAKREAAAAKRKAEKETITKEDPKAKKEIAQPDEVQIKALKEEQQRQIAAKKEAAQIAKEQDRKNADAEHKRIVEQQKARKAQLDATKSKEQAEHNRVAAGLQAQQDVLIAELAKVRPILQRATAKSKVLPRPKRVTPPPAALAVAPGINYDASELKRFRDTIDDDDNGSYESHRDPRYSQRRPPRLQFAAPAAVAAPKLAAEPLENITTPITLPESAVALAVAIPVAAAQAIAVVPMDGLAPLPEMGQAIGTSGTLVSPRVVDTITTASEKLPLQLHPTLQMDWNRRSALRPKKQRAQSPTMIINNFNYIILPATPPAEITTTVAAAAAAHVSATTPKDDADKSYNCLYVDMSRDLTFYVQKDDKKVFKIKYHDAMPPCDYGLFEVDKLPVDAIEITKGNKTLADYIAEWRKRRAPIMKPPAMTKPKRGESKKQTGIQISKRATNTIPPIQASSVVPSVETILNNEAGTKWAMYLEQAKIPRRKETGAWRFRDRKMGKKPEAILLSICKDISIKKWLSTIKKTTSTIKKSTPFGELFHSR